MRPSDTAIAKSDRISTPHSPFVDSLTHTEKRQDTDQDPVTMPHTVPSNTTNPTQAENASKKGTATRWYGPDSPAHELESPPLLPPAKGQTLNTISTCSISTHGCTLSFEKSFQPRQSALGKYSIRPTPRSSTRHRFQEIRDTKAIGCMISESETNRSRFAAKNHASLQIARAQGWL